MENDKKDPGKAGKIVLSAEEVQVNANAEMVLFNPIGKMPAEDGKLCFFILYRNIALGKYQPIYKSEIKRPESGAFRWNQVQMPTSELCKDEIEREIKIEFFRSNPNGKHKNIGAITLNLAQLKENQSEYEIDKKRGQFTMANLKVERQHSFLEYVFGGCEIDLSIAIDFTLSNGDPNRPGSLHTRNVKQNQYLQAIRSVGDILQFYN